MAYFNGKKILFSPKLVVNENYEEGYNNGLAEGVEQGKDARDLEWWTDYQNPSAFADYGSYMFAGKAWNKKTFTPYYTVGNKSNFTYAFYQHNQNGEPYDLVEHLENLGVDFDTSKCQVLQQCFAYARLSRIGIVDLSSQQTKSGTNSIFSSPHIETIDGVVFSEKTFDWHNNMFNGATALKNLTAMGIIANNGLDFSTCTALSHESLMSIINHLKDFSGTGKTYSIAFGSENLAKLTDAEKAIATQKGWTLT